MSSSSWRQSPLPANWNRLRARVLRRDGFQCVWRAYGLDPSVEGIARCLERGDGPGGRLEVDHVGPNDDHSIENLRTFCRFHHARRTAAQALEARAPRAPRNRPREAHPGGFSV